MENLEALQLSVMEILDRSDEDGTVESMDLWETGDQVKAQVEIWEEVVEAARRMARRVEIRQEVAEVAWRMEFRLEKWVTMGSRMKLGTAERTKVMRRLRS